MNATLLCVESGSFLTLHYRLAGPAGDLINTFAGKPATLTIGSGALSPALEAHLLGLSEGSRATFESSRSLPLADSPQIPPARHPPRSPEGVPRRLASPIGNQDQHRRRPG